MKWNCIDKFPKCKLQPSYASHRNPVLATTCSGPPVVAQCLGSRGVHKGGPGGPCPPPGADDHRQILCKRSYFFGIFRPSSAYFGLRRHISILCRHICILCRHISNSCRHISILCRHISISCRQIQGAAPLENGLCTPLYTFPFENYKYKLLQPCWIVSQKDIIEGSLITEFRSL